MFEQTITEEHVVLNEQELQELKGRIYLVEGGAKPRIVRAHREAQAIRFVSRDQLKARALGPAEAHYYGVKGVLIEDATGET